VHKAGKPASNPTAFRRFLRSNYQTLTPTTTLIKRIGTLLGQLPIPMHQRPVRYPKTLFHLAGFDMVIGNQGRKRKSKASPVAFSMRKIVVGTDKIRDPTVFLQNADHGTDFTCAVGKSW
jgi:hypothetical protein